jgi:hypothetical protein
VGIFKREDRLMSKNGTQVKQFSFGWRDGVNSSDELITRIVQDNMLRSHSITVLTFQIIVREVVL